MKTSRGSVVTTVLILLGGLAFLAGLTYANYRFADQNPGGNDFLVHWVGTRSLITEGLNPYSDEVALRIQTMAYGRPAQPGEHELRVAYPLYSIIVFLPFALIPDFTWARAAWMTVLEIGLILLTILSLRLARWRVGPPMLILLLLFSILWYHGLRPLINGNAVILVALGLVAGFLALRNDADELAGVLFAFTTIKPQVVVLPLLLVTAWAISRGRWKVIGWMAGTGLLLAGAAALLIPTWMVDMLREVIRYPSYNPPGTPRAAFMEWWPAWGSRLGWALTALMVVLLLVEWRNALRARDRGADRGSSFRALTWAFCLTLVVAPWTGIQTDPGNFVVLFPALALAFSLLDDRWKIGGRVFVIVSLLALLVGLWAIFLNTVQYGDQPVQSAVMFFPLPAFLLLMLYWVRWWAVQPPTVWYDMLDR